MDSEKILKQRSIFIEIPMDVIRYDNDKLVLTFIYIAMKKGIDDELSFNIDHLVSWCGYVPNHREGKMNDHFISALKVLKELGYISLDNTDISRKGKEMITVTFESDYLADNIRQFKGNHIGGASATLSVYEIQEILSHGFKFETNRKYSTASLITAFSYLRSISDRYSEYKPNEVCSQYYFEIENNIHMSSKTFMELVKILKDDLGFIF